MVGKFAGRVAPMLLLITQGCGDWPPVVDSKRDVERLPISAPSVRARGLSDDDIPSLSRLRELRASSLGPEEQINEFIAIVAREGQARKYFPRMWLRELADDGRHMGERNFADMTAIVSTLAAILADGHKAGVFQPVPAFVVQVGIVGPLFLFLATGPIRSAAALKAKLAVPAISTDMLIDHVRAMTKGALSAQRS